MHCRSIDGVLNELRDEDHPPMVLLLETLKLQPWIEGLCFDLSMLRLWVARRGVNRVEVMITYGDGRGGGRPLKPYLDAFEFTTFLELNPTDVTVQDLNKTIEKLKFWLFNKQK